MNKYTISALIHDQEFCLQLATACDGQGYGLTFPDSQKDVNSSTNCLLIDLNDKTLYPFNISSHLQDDKIIKFGLVNRLNKQLQKKANHCGYDMVFPKALFCKNLSIIVKQSIK